MKTNKEKKISSNKISFQTQLFLIISLCLILFIVAEFLLVEYSSKNKYIENEINNTLNSTVEFINDYNNTKNILSSSSNYLEKTSSSLTIINNKSGGYILNDSNYFEYIIEINNGVNTYKIKNSDYSLIFNEGDIVSGVITKYSDNYYKFESLIINDKLIFSSDNISSNISISNYEVKSITLPNNLNYLFENDKQILTGIEFLNTSINKFLDKDISGTSIYKYYFDKDSNIIYILFKLDNSSDYEYIFIESKMVNVSSLSIIIRSYYGYIILFALIIACLIALFISRYISKPVSNIEKEMINLKNGSYEKTSYNFKNKELLSLENTLNELKDKTREKENENIDRNNSLEKLNKELLKENELRKSFISRLSHELKTPLMVISATAEALQDNVIDENDKQQEYENIMAEVDKTTSIIKDIISTYKQSSKELEMSFSRFLLNDLIEEVLLSTQQIGEKNKLEIIKNINKAIYITADKELIKEVISNFITNAFKYTEPENKVEINLIDGAVDITFEVRNYGSFINTENLDKIWLPFYREKENIEDSSTGMGLFIVKEILEKHNYEYGVENFNEGVVSFFKVRK